MLILPKELARNLSNISRLVLAKRIGSGIHIVDPLTGEVRLLVRCLWFFEGVVHYRRIIYCIIGLRSLPPKVSCFTPFSLYF